MKHAIVTGGGHGIGKSIAQRLSKEGYKVIVLDSNPDYIGEINIEENITSYLCDVGSPEDIKSIIKTIKEKHSPVDCIVNNAGISLFQSIDEMSIETWNHILSVNLSSVFYLIKFIKPLLTDNSSIVNIASTRALMSEKDTEAYSATKGGIVALTHALAISLGPKTRVNCISPGWIEINDYQNLTKEDHEQHPVGRVGLVEDIAETALFLLSEKAGFITGQNIVVDGGMTKKMIYV